MFIFGDLWGPLWTHSAFGFESKNGCLKKYFHDRNTIHQQLGFPCSHRGFSCTRRSTQCGAFRVRNVNFRARNAPTSLVSTTDQCGAHSGSPQLFLDCVSHKKLRSNMVSISEHCYCVNWTICNDAYRRAMFSNEL